ncbi:MAG: hypothetical protein HY862_04350 [Chloroflexi bacterium]|nr:hypothetical protein [Chloroflexota bacterium]
MKTWFFRLIAVTFLLTGLLLLTHSTPTAYACTQPPGGLPNYTLEDRVGFAPIVLEGRVVEANSTVFPLTATIEVDQYFKGGGGPNTLTVSNFGDSSMCLSMVYVGDHIILFASGDPHSGQLTAFYASQFDAVASASPENIQTVIDTVGQPPIPPDISFAGTAEPEEIASGGKVDTGGTSQLCLGLLFAPVLLGSVVMVSRASRK